MSDLNKVLSALDSIKKISVNEWKARCPCHDDKKASLCIGYDSEADKILVHCQAGCNTDDVLSAVGLTFADIEPKRKALEWWEKNLIDKYDYTSDKGAYLYSKLRYPGNEKGESKCIRYARINGSNYIKGDGNQKHVLYKLPELIQAVAANKTIFYVEGEKDVKTLNKMGLAATTAGAVGDWKPEYSYYFAGADVVLLGDNDKPGRDLVARIKRDLKACALSVRSVFPSDEDHGDITDYIEAGHSKDDLLNLINAAERSFASWFDDKKCKINPGLLSESILNQYHFITARNPGTDTDLLYLYENGVYRKISDDETVEIIRKYVPVVSHGSALFTNISKLIKLGAPACDFTSLNKEEKYINCSNGILNIDTWNLQEHNPKIINTIQINAAYKSGEATRWNEFINDLCTDENGKVDSEEIAVIQELSGLIISSVYGFRFKKAYVLYSPEGNTGKSVYVSVMEKLLGFNAFTATDFRKLSSSRWATGSCFGKRLVAVGDQGAGEIKDSSIFKSMTGADAVPAEFKGQQPFSYVFTGVIVLACNQLPYFSDDKGNHLAGRLLLLPCRNVIDFAKRDPALVDKLLKEKDQILFWAIVGLKRLLSNGMRFSKCQAADDLMNAYRASHDTLYAFIDSECTVTGDKSDYIKRSEFDDAYMRYCQSNGLEPLLKRNIKQRAASLGIACSMLDGYNVYRKIKFKTFITVHDTEPY